MQRKADWAALIATLAVLIVAGNFLSRFKTFASGVTFCVFYIVLAVHWHNRHERWFWPVVSIVATLHLLVILFVNPELPHGPALAYVTPIMFADGFGFWGIMNWCERHFSKANVSDENA